jgi:hypothetical protein
MPLQTRVLCFFSTATAYVDAFQVIAYLRPAAFIRTSVRAVVGADDELAMPLILSTPRSTPQPQLSPLTRNSVNSVNMNAVLHADQDNSTAKECLLHCFVACLLLMLTSFTILFIAFPVNIILVVSEAVLVAVCIAIPRARFKTERKATAFATAELTKILPNGFRGRFFLAGGCFKTLLHRRVPNDLDLWPASEEDRELLLKSLQEQGCEIILSSGQFNTKLLHCNSGLQVEVTKKCPVSLVSCMAEFDLDLSCIGAEYQNGKVVAIHMSERAATGIQKREVTVVPELLRHPWNLNSLKRMDRYAEELDFAVPESERRKIWKIFEDAADEERAVLLENANLNSTDVPAWVSYM